MKLCVTRGSSIDSTYSKIGGGMALRTKLDIPINDEKQGLNLRYLNIYYSSNKTQVYEPEKIINGFQNYFIINIIFF